MCCTRCVDVSECDRCFFDFKQEMAYEMRIRDWSSDVCASDLRGEPGSPCSGRFRLIGVHREPLAGRERDGQGLVAADRDELPAGAFETHHLAEVNVDEPAVQLTLAARDNQRDRRLGQQMRALDDYILDACCAVEDDNAKAGLSGTPHTC